MQMIKGNGMAINRSSLCVMALLVLSACATARTGESVKVNVSRLVDSTTKSSRSQMNAMEELESLGEPAIPYIVSHLGDMRPVASRSITFTNKSQQSFEAFRHYKPETVHDALSALLNQMTGQRFESVSNGATSVQRQENVREWVRWCKQAYPDQATQCEGG